MKFSTLSSFIAILVAAVPIMALPSSVDIDKRVTEYSGVATYYYPDGAVGACGVEYTSQSQVVALPESLYNGGSHCGKSITIWANSNPSNKQSAIVGDLCPGCQGTYGIDLSPELFEKFAPLSQGVVDVTYYFQ